MEWTGRITALLFLMLFAYEGVAASPRAKLGGPLTAPGGPGVLGRWSNPDKVAFGSTLNRPLTFTLANGVLSEVTYPYVDRVQTSESFLLAKMGKQVFDERQAQNVQTERIPGTLAFRVRSELNGVRLVKEVYGDNATDSIIMDYRLEMGSAQAFKLIFVHDPSAERTPGGDAIEVVSSANGVPTLVARQRDIRGDEPASVKPWSYQSLTWSLPDSYAHVGFVGVNSPLERLGRVSPEKYQLAEFGNVAGGLYHEATGTEIQFRVVLSFAPTKAAMGGLHQQALSPASSKILAEQRRQWSSYLSGLKYDRTDTLAEASILVVKSLGDKRQRGAYIAAPAIPSIPWDVYAPEQDYESSRRLIGDSNGGYRRVWPRDLYHKAMALLAVGDSKSALEVLRWFAKVQQPSGMWAQNMWVNGEPSWKALQLDQVGFPIVLTERLVREKLVNYSEFRNMVLKAAQFIRQRGPQTEQERWEEIGGLSPNTVAVAVQGLLAAAQLERKAGEVENAVEYEKTAQDWIGNLKKWMLIPKGAFGSGYFARMERGGGKLGWDPSVHILFPIANKKDGMKVYFAEDEILDGGFLQWILAGLVEPHDVDFSNTLRIYDREVRKTTPWGVGYLRYNHDSYGENFQGGVWPLLSAERGIVALERGEDAGEHWSFVRRSANSAEMIGEQDTLAVRPLGWSHAAYLIFGRSISQKSSFYR